MPNVEGGIVEYFDGYPDRQTYTAAGTITGGQMVMLNGNRQVIVATANTTACIGVALHNAVSGDKITVAHQGVWPITATGAIAAGDLVACAATGTVAPVAAAGAAYVQAEANASRAVVGKAQEAIANGVAGRIKVLL